MNDFRFNHNNIDDKINMVPGRIATKLKEKDFKLNEEKNSLNFENHGVFFLFNG